MRDSTTLSTEQALNKFNSSRGQMVETVEDLSPNAKLARLLIITIRNPEYVTLNDSDIELFT